MLVHMSPHVLAPLPSSPGIITSLHLHSSSHRACLLSKRPQRAVQSGSDRDGGGQGSGMETWKHTAGLSSPLRHADRRAHTLSEGAAQCNRLEEYHWAADEEVIILGEERTARRQDVWVALVFSWCMALYFAGKTASFCYLGVWIIS